MQDDVVWADDSVGENVRSVLKEKHEIDLKSRKGVTSEKMNLAGRIAAIGTKPKGEARVFDTSRFIKASSVRHL